MKNLHTLMEALNKTVDPFTTEEIEITLSQVSKLTGGQLSEKDCQDLFHDYILDPNKNKKSKDYAEITESKRRYDLVWNKDDCGEDSLASKRFELYNRHIPVSDSTRDILAFLKELHTAPPVSIADRKKAILRAKQLALSDVPAPARLSSEDLDQLTIDVRDLELRSTQPPPESRPLTEQVPPTQLSVPEKLCLLKAVQKHCGDWDKICKEFKDVRVSEEYLKHHWRLIKATMREEVRLQRQRTPNFDYLRWLRAAIRKLENIMGKRQKPKSPELIDATQAVHRVDNLTILAMVSAPEPFEPAGASVVIPTCSSQFKTYEKRPVGQRARQFYRPFSLSMVEEVEQT